MVDINRLQRDAHNMIVRWGGGAKKGVLSLTSGTGSRKCTVARMEMKPTERALYVDGSNKFAISSYDLNGGPPNFETEVLVWQKKTYRIILPVSAPSPDSTDVFYTAITMYSGAAT